MVKRKNIRESGKINFSRTFQELKAGDRVSVIAEKSKQLTFPKRIQGRCGVVEEKRGNSVIVSIKDLDKPKQFIIDPVHLKKINAIKPQ